MARHVCWALVLLRQQEVLNLIAYKLSEQNLGIIGEADAFETGVLEHRCDQVAERQSAPTFAGSGELDVRSANFRLAI